MKKIIDGMKFGLGFGVVFMAVVYFGLGFILDSRFAETGPLQSGEYIASDKGYSPTDLTRQPSLDNRQLIPFGELSVDDQIKHASVIAIAEFRPGHDGKVRAIITDVLKKEKGVVFYYDVGDEHVSSSYYPKKQVSHGDGVAIFFTGSPATMRRSMTYHGERIGGLGDLPLKLFKEKCKS